MNKINLFTTFPFFFKTRKVGFGPPKEKECTNLTSGKEIRHLLSTVVGEGVDLQMPVNRNND